MKDWLTIGQFAQKVSLSQKALRVYEKAGLIQAHQRGDNGLARAVAISWALKHKTFDVFFVQEGPVGPDPLGAGG